MIGLLGFAAVWFGGRWKGLRTGAILLLAVAWWGVLMAVHLPFWGDGPAGALQRLTGGDLRGWLVLGVLMVPVLGYGVLIKALKRRNILQTEPALSSAFRAAELERYARHITLREIGGAGQRRLKEASVLVIGAGGLGSPAMMYLAASGVGVIGVIDDDVVENSNLQRQIIHADQRIGMAKVQSAAVAMKGLNPFIEVRPYQRRLTAEIAAELIADYDMVLDGSDNFDTREVVNAACVAAGKPLIAGAITQWEGQISLYDPAHGGPCLACVFPKRPAPGLVPTCAEAGVAAPLPGVIGAMMAMEAVKHLTGAGATLRGRLMLYDGLNAEVRVIGVKRREGCAVCGGPG